MPQCRLQMHPVPFPHFLEIVTLLLLLLLLSSTIYQWQLLPILLPLPAPALENGACLAIHRKALTEACYVHSMPERSTS